MFYRYRDLTPSLTTINEININYKNRLKTPVQIDIAPNLITITAYVCFSDNMLVPYENAKGSPRDRKMEGLTDDQTFADVACEGIKKHWGKTYTFENGETIPVEVKLVRKDDPDATYDSRQSFFKIRLTNFYNTSFVMSSPWRWLWGWPLNFCPESVMLNWSLQHTGTINLHKYSHMSTFQRVVAHEFGHVLGIGDAYEAHYRFYYEAEGTENYMMNSNNKVNPVELQMVLTAHAKGKMQYFPIKFSLKRVVTTFISNIKRSWSRLKAKKTVK